MTTPSNKAVFAVLATPGPGSTGAATFQWRKNSAPINVISNPSAATSILILTNVQTGDAGSYDCVVTNSCGGTGATSNAASLTVATLSPTGCSPADIANTDGDTVATGGGPDGAIDNGDFSAFFQLFFQGCPTP